MTITRIRRVARAAAARTGNPIEESVEGRFAALPVARRRRAVRSYLRELGILYPKRADHAHGVR